MAPRQGDREAPRAAAHVQQPRHAIQIPMPGDAHGRGHGVAVHEGCDRPRHLRRQLAGLPGFHWAALVVDRLGLQRGDVPLGVRHRAGEAEGVAPIEGTVVQQIEPRRLGGLIAAQVHLQEGQRGQHRQDALQGVQVQARALGQLLGRGRAAVLQRLDQAHLVRRRDRRHPVGRQPHVPDRPIVPDRILDAPARHAPLPCPQVHARVPWGLIKSWARRNGGTEAQRGAATPAWRAQAARRVRPMS